MKKVAVFENEFKNLEASFEAVNLLHYNNELIFEQFQTSQDFGNFNKIHEYLYAIIDIDLSPRSNHDGYQIITQIQEIRGGNEYPKIIILTGHIDINEQLKKRGFTNLPVITKPITHDDIKKALG